MKPAAKYGLITLAVVALSLFGAALHAWRLGNERRDVGLIAAMGGVASVGTAAVAWF